MTTFCFKSFFVIQVLSVFLSPAASRRGGDIVPSSYVGKFVCKYVYVCNKFAALRLGIRAFQAFL